MKLLLTGYVRLLRSSVLMAVLIFSTLSCQAQPAKLTGQWYEVTANTGCSTMPTLHCPGMRQVGALNRTGGQFVWQGTFALAAPARLVLDFKNSSVIGSFTHRIFDDRGHLVGLASGGIESDAANPFFLRHGREFNLPAGHYRLITGLASPFLLAQPEPYLDTLSHYEQAVKAGDAITLMSMGVLFGLMFYYAVLSGIRRNATDGFYALFILGNLLYNGTALLVFRELFDWHWFYLISFPILFSNGIYVLFVLRLLNINNEGNPLLYRIGMGLIGLFAAFLLLALLKPDWSLELDRTGVAMFLLFGLISGAVKTRQGHFSAPAYLAAVLVFFALGVLSISLGRLNGVYTIYIEHLGLLAVTVEALLLALVLAQQFSQLRMQFEHAHAHATLDALTGLLNRRGFFEAGIAELERSKRYERPLSIVFIDLDNFKQLNDARGHDIGDAALRATAQKLRSVLRSNDLLSRLGGDEFAILLPEIDGSAAAEAGRKIFSAAGGALQDYHPVTVSIGVIHFTKVTKTFSAIMKMADELMYDVKKSGKNNINIRYYN
ncbi:MAG TPA: diguanylate cyclase [Burkholderiales bacterium]|nr:diguanylate cyclase [Burkholderiales bacterium]